jgi:hypothetical protein
VGKVEANPIYESDFLRVTPEAIHTARGRTLPLAGVLGAEVETVPPNRLAGLSVAVVGLLVAAASLRGGGLFQLAFPLIALLGILAGLAVALAAHERYRLRIDLRDGRAHYVPATADPVEAEWAAQAIDDALHHRKAAALPLVNRPLRRARH